MDETWADCAFRGEVLPLEAAVKVLIDRREVADEGSPENNAAVDAIGKFIDDASLIAKEYYSLLGTFVNWMRIDPQSSEDCLWTP